MTELPRKILCGFVVYKNSRNQKNDIHLYTSIPFSYFVIFVKIIAGECSTVPAEAEISWKFYLVPAAMVKIRSGEAIL
jgi:hypothetical protein